MTSAEGWSFAIDEDEMVAIRPPAGVSANIPLALEWLVFSLDSSDIEDFLEIWRAPGREAGFQCRTPSAVAARVSDERVELRDVWNKFDDCAMDNDLFEEILSELVRFMKERDM